MRVFIKLFPAFPITALVTAVSFDDVIRAPAYVTSRCSFHIAILQLWYFSIKKCEHDTMVLVPTIRDNTGNAIPYPQGPINKRVKVMNAGSMGIGSAMWFDGVAFPFRFKSCEWSQIQKMKFLIIAWINLIHWLQYINSVGGNAYVEASVLVRLGKKETCAYKVAALSLRLSAAL
ncbi:hypothetical protein CC78DRAFT_548129 [Lojkania enalia]|uniref:Uncharacterized protein n=1 Tax=Lojkania enalia TaxID=147567 RepID=A0A9P4K1P3_9PLEO|nr:hypothetical protein CC78DRAFT_548129 [Didymosphaeria enalia]